MGQRPSFDEESDSEVEVPHLTIFISPTLDFDLHGIIISYQSVISLIFSKSYLRVGR